MRFLKKLGFISAFICSFFTHSNELIYMGKQTIDYLNAWCPDAWCAGDYNYVFLDFVFNSNDKNWYLSFLSFPHGLTEISESFSYPHNILSKQMIVRHSICPFLAQEPSSIFLFSKIEPTKILGISPQMRENLNNCITNLE